MTRKTASRYRVRTEALKALGFASYKEYLKSPLWAEVRARIMARDGGCVTCRKPAYTVHHITYSESVLQGLDDSQLVSTCRGCHYHAEFDQEAKLTYTTEIAEKLRRRMIKNGVGKKQRKAHQPRCRCCNKQYRKLGRDDICLDCHKSVRSRSFSLAHTIDGGASRPPDPREEVSGIRGNTSDVGAGSDPQQRPTVSSNPMLRERKAHLPLRASNDKHPTNDRVAIPVAR